MKKEPYGIRLRDRGKDRLYRAIKIKITAEEDFFSSFLKLPEVVNFKPDDLFMRGINTVKQGNSELFRFIGKKIMWKVIGINNTHLIHKIVEDAL
ncbi:9932_t:CDS:2 [Funneliformis geosporum]|uniref:9932_t:CDS:1 n=1 Tax=Funneliformis geosporum TaxID=1117311 RepID=A0A9W4WR18_9GLOM|nr:9932_t:CDS:2 [Funneliformis geosporum]